MLHITHYTLSLSYFSLLTYLVQHRAELCGGHGGGGRWHCGGLHCLPPGQEGQAGDAPGQAGAHLGLHLARGRADHCLPPLAQREESPLGVPHILQPDHGRDWPGGRLPQAGLTQAGHLPGTVWRDSLTVRWYILSKSLICQTVRGGI